MTSQGLGFGVTPTSSAHVFEFTHLNSKPKLVVSIFFSIIPIYSLYNPYILKGSNLYYRDPIKVPLLLGNPHLSLRN